MRALALAAALAAAACTAGSPPPARVAGTTAAPPPSPTLSTLVDVPPPPPGPSPSPSPAHPPPAPAAGPRAWRLLAGGDVLMDRSEAAGFDPFARIRPRLASADLALVNVEMAVAATGTPAPKGFVLLAPPSAAATMAAAGVDAGNLANNHVLDYGPDAMAETIAHLRAAGVAPVGAGPDVAAAFATAGFNVGGVRVAVMGTSRIVPAGWAAGEGPGIASAYAEGRLLRAVRAARRIHDAVVVMIHWGVEGDPCPGEDQERLGAALVSAGATVVLGSHPHVLQPVAARGDGLVAFSLGNFVWHRRSGRFGETGVLEVALDGGRVVGHAFHPHLLDGRGAPVPARGEDAARIAASVQETCVPPSPSPGPSL